MITVGSLFSGIGGIELGLERSGMECIWQCENDPYAIRVLEKHWPNVTRFNDVRNMQGGNVETPDIICGGFPCQPVSFAGKRKAQSDSRWLWPEFSRLLDEIQPRFAIMENVPGLLTSAGAEVIADLAALGFNARWCCFSASSIGAWHKRDRWWCVTSNANRSRVRPQSLRIEGVSNTAKFEHTSTDRGGVWSVEPNVGRVAHGVPNRVDRLRCLGNAVVPQCAELVGMSIMERINEF